ncbi:hypothetical protein GC170_10290 [bacterium]|nr:hypothetical protein [bacterium]
MAEFYSMEEAARVLGIGLDELKLKIQSGELRQIGGGASPQFRKTDIDEFARRQGLGSDPDLNSDLSLDDLDFSDLFVAPGDSSAKPSPVGSAIAPATGMSTTSQEINPLGAASGVTPGASDIQVVKVAPQGASDSDIRIVPDTPAKKGPSDSDVTLLSADSAVLDISNLDIPGATSRPGDTALGTVEMGSSGEIPLLDEDSDFDLTPSGVIDALRPESGSDFELAALDSSSEFEVVGTHSVSATDIPVKPSGSGVNLSKPNDSGIGLAGFDADSIELAPIDDAAPAKAAAAPQPQAVPKPGDTGIAAAAATSFDDTDFQIDDFSDSGEKLMEATGDRTVEIGESSSDVEIFESDDISIISGEESPMFGDSSKGRAGVAAKAKGEGLLDDSSSWDTSGESEEAAESAEIKPKTAAKPSPALVRTGTPTEWGTPWVVGLFFSTAMMLLLCMVTFDLLRNLYEFRGNTPVASGLVKQIAGLIGGK